MKKTILILVALTITGFSATQTLARSGEPSHNDRNGHYRQGQNLTDEEIQTRQAFMASTADLRQTLASKMGEYRAIMAANTPDSKAAGQLAGEIQGIKNQLREKAMAAGLPGGRGMGRSMGMNMGGHGAGDGHRGNCGW